MPLTDAERAWQLRLELVEVRRQQRSGQRDRCLDAMARRNRLAARRIELEAEIKALEAER